MVNSGYNAQNKNKTRKVTLTVLAAAVVIIGAVFGVRKYLKQGSEDDSSSVAVQPPPTVQGIPLPGTAAAQLNNSAVQPNSVSTASVAMKSTDVPKAPPTTPPVQQQVSTISNPLEEANTPVLSGETAKLLAEAQKDIAALNFIAARDKLNDALRRTAGTPQETVLKSHLQNLSEKWLFSQNVLHGDTLCSSYTVRPGDTFTAIGTKHKVPAEFLVEINHISPQLLKAGQSIKVVNGPFHTVVHRTAFTMDVYLQSTYVCTFKVGLGQTGMETPTGLWRVASGGKLITPRWTDPKSGRTYEPSDPDYPLGSRWIALDGIEGEAVGKKGFAIHGTKDPHTIGTKSSQGCIRLFNGDVIKVYNMLVPTASEVRIIN